MGYAERLTWTQLVSSLIATGVYFALVIPQLSAAPASEIDWGWPMLWCMLGGIAISIGGSIIWGIVAGMRDPDQEHRLDQRDREIERFGDRIGQAFLVIGGVAALVLSALRADWFWIGHAVFIGFFLSAVVGGIARLIGHRRGFQEW